MKPAVVLGSRTQGLAVIRSLGANGVPAVVRRYHDQDRGYGSRWAREVIDWPHPERDPGGFDAVLAAVARRFPGSLLVPGVLKPTVSHRYKAVFGRTWTRVDSLEEAVRHYREARAADFDVVAQELIPGDELCGANYHAYVWGNETVEMTAAKIRDCRSDVHWVDITRDVKSCLSYPRRDGCSVGRFVQPYLSRPVFGQVQRLARRKHAARLSSSTASGQVTDRAERS